MVTARTAVECIEIQSKITYDRYKQNETDEVRGDPTTIYSLDKREMTFNRPINRIHNL